MNITRFFRCVAICGAFAGGLAAQTLSGVPYPNSIASNGVNQFWVASTSDGFQDNYSGSAYRINAAGTAVLGQKMFPTYALGVSAAVWANGSIWVLGQTNSHTFDLIGFDGSSGITLTTVSSFIPVGASVAASPMFDGSAIWYAVAPLGFGNFAFYKYTISTGTTTVYPSSFAMPHVTLAAATLDGQGHAWMAVNGALGGTPAVWGMNVADGSTYALYSYPSGAAFFGSMTFDGTNLWVVDEGANDAVYTINPATGIAGGTVIHSVFANNGVSPVLVTFDGIDLWVAVDGQLSYKFTLAGTPVNFYATGAMGAAMAFFPVSGGGGTLWVSGYTTFTLDRIGVGSGS